MVRFPTIYDIHNYGEGWTYAHTGSVLDALRWGDDRTAAAKRQLSDRCWSRYLERLDEKRRELAEYVRGRLEGREDVTRGGERMNALRQAMRSWISMAFDVIRDRADVVGKIVSGRVGLPDIAGMLQDGPWTIADQADRTIERAEKLLRSRGMRDVVEYGFGHRLLTEAEFAVLGDMEEQNSGNRTTVGRAR